MGNQERPTITCPNLLYEYKPDGTEGQDRESYSDTQDRDCYVPDPKLEKGG